MTTRAPSGSDSRARTAFILISGSGVGGAEKRFVRTFLHLQRDDDSYHLILNQGLHDALLELGFGLEGNRNVKVLRHSLGPMSDPRRRKLYMLLYPWQCLQIALASNIQTVHLLGSGVYIGFPYAAVSRFRPGFRIVVSIYDVAVDQTVSRLTRPLFRFMLRRADAIDLLSDDIRDRLVESRYNAGGQLAGKLHVMPCSFADYRGFEAREPRPDRVTFLGRLEAIKRPLLFVDAMPGILRRHPGTEFQILGRGPLEEAIRQRIAELGIADRVTVRFATAPQEYLSRSKIFVSLQHDNNYPSQSLLEAMACENAVVATDVGETWKLVNDDTGLRVAADSDSVARAIGDLLDDPERLARLGRGARRLVTTEHTIERAAAHLRDLHLGRL